MTIVNGYCTEAEFRDQLNDTGSDLDVDLIHQAINAASRWVDDHCSGGVPGARRFWRDAAVTTRVFAPDRVNRAWVDDIGTTVGLIVKTDDNDDGVYETTWTASDYQLEPLNQDIVALGDTVAPYAWWEIVAVDDLTFPVYLSQRASLQITAKFGWSAVPDEVKQATILKAVGLFRRKDAPFGVAGFAEFGPVRISRVDPDVIDLLSKYVKSRSRTLTYYPQNTSLYHWRAAGT